jgi:hypothetical protein
MAQKNRRTRVEDLETTLRKIVLALRQEQIPYMLIGALALPVWGRPRATLDIDFMILAPEVPQKLIPRLSALGFDLDLEWQRLNPFLKGVQARFRSKILTLDILLRRDEHHEEAFRRRRKKRYRDMFVWFPSAEDLILLKLRAGRPTDFDDVSGILERLGNSLDLPYLSRWARRLGLIEELNYVIDRFHPTDRGI